MMSNTTTTTSTTTTTTTVEMMLFIRKVSVLDSNIRMIRKHASMYVHMLPLRHPWMSGGQATRQDEWRPGMWRSVCFFSYFLHHSPRVRVRVHVRVYAFAYYMPGIIIFWHKFNMDVMAKVCAKEEHIAFKRRSYPAGMYVFEYGDTRIPKRCERISGLYISIFSTKCSDREQNVPAARPSAAQEIYVQSATHRHIRLLAGWLPVQQAKVLHNFSPRCARTNVARFLKSSSSSSVISAISTIRSSVLKAWLCVRMIQTRRISV